MNPSSPVSKSQINDSTVSWPLPSFTNLTDRQKIEIASLANAKQKSLELLYDYTKFHIGVYLTLSASYLTAAFANFGGKPVLTLNLNLIAPAILFTMIAGFSGGVIVSSLTQWVGGCTNDFLESKIGPWDWEKLHMRARLWTYLEHISFWLGLIMAVLSFVPQARWSDAVKALGL